MGAGECAGIVRCIAPEVGREIISCMMHVDLLPKLSCEYIDEGQVRVCMESRV